MIRVFLICIACCCSSFMPLKQSESIVSEDHIQEVERKTKDNYYHTSSGYYNFGSSDLLSYEVATNIINYYYSIYNDSNILPYHEHLVSGQWEISTSQTHEVWMYNDGGNYVKQYNVGFIVLQKSVWETNGFLYKFIFSNSAPYDRQVIFEWYFQWNSGFRLYLVGATMKYTGYLDGAGSGNDASHYLSAMARLDIQEKESGSSAFLYNVANVRSASYNAGFNDGNNSGYQNGYADGRDSVVNDSTSTAYQTIYNAGYQSGYSIGMADGIDTNSLPATIFTGIINVGLLPVNVFLQMFNYEIFGVNIAGLISSLLTIAVVIIVIRVVTGKKND